MVLKDSIPNLFKMPWAELRDPISSFPILVDYMLHYNKTGMRIQIHLTIGGEGSQFR